MITKYLQYIKESNDKIIFNIGDYVEINEKLLYYWKNHIKNNVYEIAKIKDVNFPEQESPIYVLDVIENDNLETYYLTKDSFTRKLNNNEINKIEKLDLIINTQKYNL